MDIPIGSHEDPLLALHIHLREIPLGISSINAWVWRQHTRGMHCSLQVCCVLIALAVSAVAALPYLWYSALVPESVCAMRFAVYFAVFSGHWVYLLTSHYMYLPGSAGVTYIIRGVLSVIFAGVYAFMYSVKWYTVRDTWLRIPQVLLFSACWFYAFYCVVDKHLSTAISLTGIDTSRCARKKRECLLRSIKHVEQHVAACADNSQDIYETLSLCNLSSLVARTVIIAQTEERMAVYEERSYDPCGNIRVCVVNVFLGVCLVCMSLAMIDDYGYPLAMLLKNDNATAPLPVSDAAFLSSVTVFCACLSGMYISATYPIPHKYAAKRCNPVSLLLNAPIIVFAAIIATVRMNTSYSMFGVIAERCLLPESLGTVFVWCGVAVVFVTDLWGCMKITSCALKRYATLLALTVLYYSVPMCETVQHWARIYAIRKYTKRLKYAVRNCEEMMLERLFDAVL